MARSGTNFIGQTPSGVSTNTGNTIVEVRNLKIIKNSNEAFRVRRTVDNIEANVFYDENGEVSNESPISIRTSEGRFYDYTSNASTLGEFITEDIYRFTNGFHKTNVGYGDNVKNFVTNNIDSFSFDTIDVNPADWDSSKGARVAMPMYPWYNQSAINKYDMADTTLQIYIYCR